MTKMQIRLPEALVARLRSFARRRQCSLAETLRRGAELLLETYAEEAPPAYATWRPPSSGRVGWKGLTAEQLADLEFEKQSLEGLAG